MAVTYSATLQGKYRSSIRNSLICNAAGASEALTIVHRLGACPTEVRFALRSVTTSASTILPAPQITAIDASQVTVAFGFAAANAATSQQFDVICELTHSLVK